VGLRNTRDRLELLYPGRHDFDFRGAPGRGCEVSLTFPLVMAPAARPPAAAPRRAVAAAPSRLAPTA